MSIISSASCGPGEVCLTWTDRRRDPQHAISRDAWERLKDARDAHGRRLEVTRLPMPGPLKLTAREAAGVVAGEGTKVRRAGERLAGSYVNFYIANGGIVMPLLDARTDRIAAQRLKRLFLGAVWWASRRARFCSAAATFIALRNRSPQGTRTRSPSAK